jgi:PAS domain S-box-containing protein
MGNNSRDTALHRARRQARHRASCRALQRTPVRYTIGFATVAAAFALRMLLEPITGTGAPFVLFFGAIVATSLLAGPGPGILATVLSLPVGALVFVMPAGFTTAQVASQATLFAVDAAVILYLSFVMTRARRASESARERLRSANDALSRSEARWRDLIELAPDAFFLADLDGRFTDVNRAACRLLGYEREELVGKTIMDIIPVEDAPRLAAVRSALLVPGQIERAEWTHRRKDGSLVSVEVSSNVLSGGRWQAFVRDVSERKRVEDERQRADEAQRFLTDAGAALSTSLDYEQTMTTVGELAVRDMADWCIVDVVEEDDRPRRLKVICADPRQAPLAARFERLPLDRSLPHLSGPVLATRRPLLVEAMTADQVASFAQSAEHLEILRAIGPRSVLGLPLLIRGQLLGVLVLISTTPARAYGAADLRLGQSLADRAALAIENGRLYQRALHATQIRDEVLGVVAHDLRNPVSAIVMQTQLLQRKAAGPEATARDRRATDRILRAATRMNRLIGDLLDATAIDAGRLGIERGPVPARTLLADAAEAQRPLASSASLALRLDAPIGLPDIWGDHHRLLQVLENLIGNAIKFTPGGGRVTVGAAAREGEVLFWVADTGGGISPDDIPHVFDRFWQARKGAHGGAGLGLPIAQGIVAAHGGRIWVDSQLGRGSTFFFTIPQAHPMGTRSPEALH